MSWWDYVLFALFLLILAYLSVRVGSIAYFRTKLEHFRSVIRITREGEHNNGKE